MIKLLHGDCLELMKDIPNNHIDLTVTSPPYDNLRTYNDSLVWGEHIWKPIIKELFRITKDGGVVVWVVGDATIKGSETGTSFKQALWFMECGYKLHDTMIYEKNGSPFPSKNRYYQCFEYMFIFCKGAIKTSNLITDRKNKWLGSWGKRTLRDKDGSLLQGDYINCKEYGIRFNIWKINNGFGFTTQDKEAYQHPAIFPEQLANDHIISWSNKGDLVFDPFMGSGTTGKMAKQNERDFIGIEKDATYFELAKNRIENHTPQMELIGAINDTT